MGLNGGIIASIIVGTIIVLIFLLCFVILRIITNHGPQAITLTKNIKLPNKIIIITGANAGIGAESVRVLSYTNATIIMACRNIDKGNIIKDQIISETSNKNIVVMKLDLGSIKSINEFVTQFKSTYNKLDILLCNAGVAPRKEGLKTMDGLEMAFGVNHIGNMHLCLSLHQFMNETSDDPRIVITNAELHKRQMGRFTFDINNLEQYSTDKAYGHSKLCNLMFIKEFIHKYPISNEYKVLMLTLHPGVGITELMYTRDKNGNSTGPQCMGLIKCLCCFCFALTDNVGQLAYTQVYLSVHNNRDTLINGGYYRNNNIASYDNIVDDKALISKMWDVSLKYIEKYNIESV